MEGMECGRKEKEVKNEETRAVAKDGGDDGRGNAVVSGAQLRRRMKKSGANNGEVMERRTDGRAYRGAFLDINGDTALSRRTISPTWLATRRRVWQALPSPSISNGVAESVLVTWLRSVPRSSTEQVGEESSPPATHRRCLAVNVGTADYLARLRLLRRLLLPLLLLPFPLLRTTLCLPLPPLLYANFPHAIHTSSSSSSSSSSSFLPVALIWKSSYFIAIACTGGFFHFIERNGRVLGDAKKLSICCNLMNFISDAPLNFFFFSSFPDSCSFSSFTWSSRCAALWQTALFL
ncbi:unnamed protein product [Taenia asiatica]|uniref:Uncharacterized protein n=1 Tax=Taenia asiatica TaxID=60517 RepID=A0A0R3VYH5_TAEAS|nr:unnamed protein product [Taenia asiatica]